MRHAAGVPQLHEYQATCAVHCIGNSSPGAHVAVQEDARSVEITLGLAADHDGLGDQQSGFGPLSVVCAGPWRRGEVGQGPVAGAWREHNAVAQAHAATKGAWFEQRVGRSGSDEGTRDGMVHGLPVRW